MNQHPKYTPEWYQERHAYIQSLVDRHKRKDKMRLIKRILSRLSEMSSKWYSYSLPSAVSHITAVEIPVPDEGEIYETLYPKK